MNNTAKIILVTSCLSIAACGSTFRDRSNDYRQAELGKKLELPEEINADKGSEGYVDPALQAHSQIGGEFVVPRPEAIKNDVDRGKVRIQKLGEVQWVLMNGAPGEVWPLVRSFLNLSKLAIARAEAATGVLETQWLQPEGTALPRERYRFRIEQGVQRNTSEVYVLQANASFPNNWPRYSTSKERETLMTQVLAQFLADADTTGTYSMLAQQNAAVTGKITFERSQEGRGLLRLKANPDRAWASISAAMKKAGFSVNDWNRSAGRYWATLTTTPPKKGWLSGKPKSKTVAYWVEMRQIGPNEVAILIRRQDGVEISVEEEESLLRKIKAQIS